MKKAIFAVLVVVLAMLATTCDSAVLPAKSVSEPGMVNPTNPGWTTISIDVGGADNRARAMSQALNSGSVNYYEVVFVYNEGETNSTTTRYTNNGTTPWTVSVPTVDYTVATGNKNKAVLFAGVSGSPNVLVAVGEVTAGGNILTAGANPTITFTLSPITNPSPFNLSGASSGTTVTNPDGLTGTQTITVHKVGESASPVAATYKFHIPKPGVVVSAAGTVTSDTVSSPTPAIGPLTVTGTTPISGELTSGADATFSFSITPGITPGYSKIYISVPVILVNNLGSAGSWALEGGLNNDTLDDGITTTAGNGGGAILIEVVAQEVDITSTATAAQGWDTSVSPKTWNYVPGATGATALNITLTAEPVGITGTPTYAWKTNTSGTPAGTDAAATTINGVTAANAVTLTIPSTSTNLNAAAAAANGNNGTEFYVYCTVNGVDSEVVKIHVKNPASGNVTINQPITYAP